MSKKTVLFITGSGKCGTSVVAHAFFSAGFPMGSKSELLIEGPRGNIRGYWEHVEMLRLNRRILLNNGLDWHTVAECQDLHADGALQREMRAFAEGVPDGFCCKEPRLVWTAELWSQFFSEVTLVGVFRNPAGFMQSAAYIWPENYGPDVNGGAFRALKTWEAANRRLLELGQRHAICWICFDDPAPVLKERLRRIIGKLGRQFNEEAFDTFYVPEERRFSSEKDIDDSLNTLPPDISELYRKLRVAANAEIALRGFSAAPAPSRWSPPAAGPLYLDLLKRCLTRTLFPDGSIVPGFVPEPGHFRLDDRANGRDWPSEAETMIGLRRLDNIQYCVMDVQERGIPGDLVEAGVWRGGAGIFMRAMLAAYDETRRRVWLADSFQGLPQPDSEHFPMDAGDRHWELTPILGIPLEVVRENFERYKLLDDQVEFLAGWFRDTLPEAPIERIAVLRVDADMYESTFEALQYLYPKVSPGGYVIIDDYGVLPNCKAAVDDYRLAHGIVEAIQPIDWSGVYWQKV